MLDKFDFHKDYAVICQNFSINWERYYEWSGSSRKFTGRFKTVEDAINDIPKDIKHIRIDVTDNDGKPINYTINR